MTAALTPAHPALSDGASPAERAPCTPVLRFRLDPLARRDKPLRTPIVADIFGRIFATATRGEAASHPRAATDLMPSESPASGVSESVTTDTPTRPGSGRKRHRRTPAPMARPLLPSDDKRAPTTRHPRRPREEPDHLLDVHEAAAMLGLKHTTLYRWSYARRISTVKVGGKRGALRFRRSDVEALIARSVCPARRGLDVQP